MKSLLLAMACSALCALTAGGCATITNGTTQAITVDSEPQQADCTLLREGQELGSVKTPGPLTVKRHAATIHVICRKEGFEDGRVIMNSRYETASSGNFLLGGVIGVMVDASSGANSRYETYVMVPLTPLVPGDAARIAMAPPKPTPRPAPAEKPTVVASAPEPGPFDGDYKGGFQFDTVFSDGLRRVELTVSNGQGAGKVTQERCSSMPGPVTLAIAPSGAVTGDIDILERGNCAPLKGKVTGRAEGGTIKLTVTTDSRKPLDITLTRRDGKG